MGTETGEARQSNGAYPAELAATASILESWLRAAVEATGATQRDPALLSRRSTTALLDLARDAARQVARPAAPLATFALGLAIGHHGGSVADLEALAAKVSDRAAKWRLHDVALQTAGLIDRTPRRP